MPSAAFFLKLELKHLKSICLNNLLGLFSNIFSGNIWFRMEKGFYSQPVSKRVNQSKTSIYHSQPSTHKFVNHDQDVIHNIQKPVRDQPGEVNRLYRTEDTVTSSPLASGFDQSSDSNITKLFDNYKCISDELTSSLKEFRTEKISLENRLSCLNQENEYLKLEIDRQKAHIDDLSETSKSLSEKLTKEETETKKIVELKLLEIQEIFASITSADKFINDFKSTFSNSVAGAQEFCKNIKKDLKELNENSLKDSSDYSNNVDDYSSEYTEELKQIRRSISETETKIENGIIKIKEKSLEETRFKQELNSLLQEIEKEQKKKKELETSLLHHSDMILKMKENHYFYMDNIEIETNELNEHFSQLTLKNSALDLEISGSENDLINLKEKYSQMASELNSLQTVLMKKRHEDDMIQQEIEELEKNTEILKNDYNGAIEELECKREVEIKLKELELEVFSLAEKCKQLEKAKCNAAEANPIETLATAENNLKQTNYQYEKVIQNVETSKTQLEEKQKVLNNVREEGYSLRCVLNEKMVCLNNTPDETLDLDNLRRGNEQLSSSIQICEQWIEEKKKIIFYLQQLQFRQNEVYEKYKDDYEEDLGSSDDKEMEELFFIYKETLESMEELEVTDLDDRMKRVSADVEYNVKQADEALEAHKQDFEKLQAQRDEIVKELENDAEEHSKYCGDVLAKLDSEMRYVQGKICNSMDDVNIKRNELHSRIPKLATSVNMALGLFEKIVYYYAQACDQRHSGSSSIHWDNTKEVLQEILLHPLYKLSKLKGMPFIDTLSASPHTYLTVIHQARDMFVNLSKEKEGKSIEYTCKKLMDMRSALYHLSNDTDSPVSNRLNDSNYSTSTEDIINKIFH